MKNLDCIRKSLKISDYDISDVAILCDAINSNFKKSDISISIVGEDIVISFLSVDIEKYRNIVYKSNISDRLMKDVYDAVESVKSYGVKGKKRVYVSYNSERKVINRKEKEDNRGKYYYASCNEFSTKNNDVPQEFTNRILCADSLIELKKFPDNCIDIIFTSPPYNFGLTYDSNDGDAVNWVEYYNKLFEIFRECIRVLKYGGRFVVNVQPMYSDYIPSHHIISNFFMENKMIWKGEIIWEKNNYNCKMCSYGSWKSPSSPYLKYTWEFLEVYCKGSIKHDGTQDKADITADEFKSWVVAKWSIAPERNMKEYGHPAMFPENLAERVLKLFSFEGDIVLDPFNGAGTTTAVANKLGRKYIGIDISQEYCKTAENRIKDYNDRGV